MTDPGEVISAIFSLAVMSVVVIMVIGVLIGWDISGIANTVSSLAVPFVVILLLIFAFLQVS